MESEYIKRVKDLALIDPSLNRVLQYIDQQPAPSSLDHEFVRALVFDHGHPGSSSNTLHPYHGARTSLKRLGHALRSNSSARKTVIIQDLQPAAMLHVGAFLSINPVCFEHYLNRSASFETFDSAVLVFDYPETLLYGGETQLALQSTFSNISNLHARGNLARVWLNLYIYSQRIVSVRVPGQAPQPDVHLLLIDSLPKFSPLTYHLTEKSTALWNRTRIESTSFDALSCLQKLIMEFDLGISNQEPVGNAIADFLSSKWQTLLYYAQVKISESKAPLTGDLQLIAEVIQRKHDFEKMERTMMANLGSARLLPSIEPDGKRLSDLRAYQAIIAGWASQLEKVASSLQGLLAVSESLKASQQATRTQNLTMLAFVFIPLSTVSSIYGMNTVEITQNNPHMWQFGISASVTTLVAIFGAWSYKYWFNIFQTIWSSTHKSGRERTDRPVHSAPVVPARPSPRRASRLSHRNPLKVSPDMIPQNVPFALTDTLDQASLAAEPMHLGFRKGDSDVENGQLTNDGGVFAFQVLEPNGAAAATGTCVVM